MKRKVARTVALVAVIVLVFVLLCVFVVKGVVPASMAYHWQYADAWRYSAAFEEYEGAFVQIKDFLLAQYPNGEEKRLKMDIGYDGVHNDEIFGFPDEIVDALTLLHGEAFPYKTADFTAIVIDGERIAFESNNGRYALVYSANGRPTYTVDANDTEDVWVKRAGKGWYHVTEDMVPRGTFLTFLKHYLLEKD